MVKRKYSEMASKEVKIEPKPMGAIPTQDNNHFLSPTQSTMPGAEQELRTVMDDFVQVYERLDTGDNVTNKPNYSYTELVYLAILRSPNFCLPITEIYKYIQNKFSFFRNSTRQHWKNAVRHSLSKTKCFTKISVGRGVGVSGVLNRSTYLWCIIPSSIVSFARGDYRPNVDKESGTNTLRWGYYRVNAGQFWDQVAVYLDQKMQTFKRLIASNPRPGLIFELQKCSLPEKSENIPDEEPVKLSSSDEIKNVASAMKWMVKPEEISKVMNPETDVIASTNDISPLSARDSGNETLSDSSPDDDKYRYLKSCRMDRPSLNSSYLSSERVSVDEIDVHRKTPDTLDFGQLSPLELSPISTVFQDDSPTYFPALVSTISTLPPPAYTAPSFSYYDSAGYYQPQYHIAHDRNFVYPSYYPDISYAYPVNYMPAQGNEPMFSNITDWNTLG